MNNFIIRFHKHIIVISLLLTVAALYSCSCLKLEFNILSLLPSSNQSVETFFEVTEEIGLQSLLVVLVDMPEEYNQQDSEKSIEDLADRFMKSGFIKRAEFKNDDTVIQSLYLSLVRYLPYSLNPEDLKRLGEQLSDDGIIRQVKQNRKMLMTPFNLPVKEMIQADPLGLRDITAQRLSGSSIFRGTGQGRGYFKTKDSRTYFMFLEPVRPPQDMAFSRSLMSAMARIKTRVIDEDKGITLSFTGGYPIAVKDEAVSKKDIRATVLTSFVGVMILFGLWFRALRPLLYVGVPLAISLIWTLGLAGFLFGRINILSCVFSCVLVGIGVDFAIHIINRYFDKTRSNLDAAERLGQTFQEAGAGIVIGGFTTALAFFSIGFSDFGGFRELGILTGTGILLCLGVMFFLLPSILVFFSGSESAGGKIVAASFGLRPFLDSVQKYSRISVLVCFICICLLAVIGKGVRFDDNFRNFRPEDDSVINLQDRVTKWLGGSTAEILVVVEGETEEQAMNRNEAVFRILKQLQQSGKILRQRSISEFVTSPELQKKNIALIRENPDVFNIKRIKATFTAALKKNGFSDPGNSYDCYFDALAQVFNTESVLLLSTLAGTNMEQLVHPFSYEKGNEYKIVTYINPSKDLWSGKDIFDFKEMIIKEIEKSNIPAGSFSLTGVNLLTHDIKQMIIKNLKSSLLLAIICILFVLSLYYRQLSLVILSILPLAAGLACLAGFMKIFHIDFNFFNIMVVPMIAGIGIDDGVHFTNTFLRAPSSEMPEQIAKTGRAVMLTSLTTLVGFGSIALSHYPGLKSMGVVAVIGITACLLASIVLLPAVFKLFKK